jgi:DNA-binding response OmpR family regulator
VTTPKILLLEDDQTMLPLLGRVLSLNGFLPLFPRELSEISILDQIRIDKPDAIFMDVHLGIIDTIDLMKRMHNDRETNPPPILMTSGFDVESDCIEAGADGFLMKPFNPSDLLDWLNSHCVKDNK